jgi:thiosulfate/3-mercaptopyruvate sulfurtransferase
MYADPFISLLISGDELEAKLGIAGLLVIDARSAGYEAGHIPGAISLKWSDYVNEDKSLKTTAALEEQLGEAGLSRDKVFVIYDDTTASWGAAGRVFWMLEYLGCGKVHVLNGGWDKWSADGRASETEMNTLREARFTANVQDDVLMTKGRLAGRLGDDDFAVIDSRTDEEFNGWTLYGEARGGHIPGAVQLPYAGFFKEDKSILDYDDLKELFDSHGITSDKEVTAYCTVGIRSGFVYFLLRTLGYPRVSNYAGSIAEWSADRSLPMEKMENYQALVYPEWVDKLIKGENPPTYPGNGYVILYTSYEPRYSENRTDYVGTVYETGHIPGAIFMDTYSVENGPN